MIAALIEKIRIVKDESELQQIIRDIKPGIIGKPVRIAFVNAHAFNMAFENPEFLNALLDCDYIFRDGSGMKILFKMLGMQPGMNMNGTDFIPRIMDAYAGQDVALLGTDTPYLDSAASVIADRGLYPVLIRNGFHESQVYVDALRETPVPLVILAMGMPKQERVAAHIASSVHFPTLIVCGGAILDFIGGKVRRAPAIFQKLGMEWLFRLWQEPRRLFRRYVFGNAVFLHRAFKLSRNRTKAEGGRMKILHVVRQYAPSIGGLESYVQSLTRYQKAMGHDCEVLTLNKIFHGADGDLPPYEEIYGVPVHRVPFYGRRRFFIPMVSPSFFKKYDVVHIHNTDVFYDYGAIVAALTGIPFVATTHGGFFHTNDFSLIKKIYFQTITRIASLFYKKIFAISRNDEENFSKISKSIVFQPNAIEPLGADIYNGDDLVYIGRLAQNKNIPRLIEVFSHLKNTHGIAGTLHIIGPEWDVAIKDLEAAARLYNIAGSVVFHGAIKPENMRDILKNCGYFASASLYEGFGMSMLEGMSVGLIPLVHNNESFTQLVGESGCGIAVSFDNPAGAAEDIAARMKTVETPERRQAQDFVKQFSWPALAAETVSAYKDLLE